MGQKVDSNGLRIGIYKNWVSRWFSEDNAQTAKWLIEDEKIRKYIIKHYDNSMINSIEIERKSAKNSEVYVYVYCVQPGVVIGKDAENIATITKAINKIVGRNVKVFITINEFVNPGLSARIIARELANNIEQRVPLRLAMRSALKKAMRVGGAKGIKILVSGRLNGAEIARDKGYTEGIIPLSTLRADIDYSLELAHTSYGVIGVKVWVNRGEIFERNLNAVRVYQKPKSFNDNKHANHRGHHRGNSGSKNVERENSRSESEASN